MPRSEQVDDNPGGLRWLTAEAESVLSGAVGHDLRNPLAAITTCLAVMKRLDAVDERRQHCLEVIDNSTARLQRMLSDLCDLLQAIGSGIPVRPAPVHLDAVCQSVLRDLRAAHPDRHVSYETRGDGLGQWDAVRLSQAVRNLASNAFRYGDPATPVEVRWDGGDTDRVWVEVASRGPTIPEETLGELCRPRVRRRPSAEREGLGVGIFLADRLAAAHGGSLQVSSSDSRTAFRIELPRHPPAP